MNNGRDVRTDDGADDGTVRLLRLAGPRSNVPDIRAARVRSAVRAEWQVVTRRRVVRRRVAFTSTFLAAAAVVVLLVGRLDQSERRASLLGETVAVVEQIAGTPQRLFDDTKTSGLARNDSVRAGEWIDTDAHARVALRFSDGTSVRLDVGSRVRPLSSSAIELVAGGVYVDTGRESGRFEVRTALATARDVGTQFEIRLRDSTVRLRVRTGLVELKDRTRTLAGRAGTEITLSPTDAMSRPIAAYGSEWKWAANVSPPLAMEGLSLSAFLERVAREHGWSVRYADDSIAAEAARVVLHGSVDGLGPEDAVQVAVTIGGLRYRLDRGDLVVGADEGRKKD